MDMQLDGIMPEDPGLAGALEQGYAEAKNFNFKDPSLKVMNFTHDDLDGAVAGIVMKNVFPRVSVRQVNYRPGQMYQKAVNELRSLGKDYDVIIFTDYCPGAMDTEMYDALHFVGKPFLVIDHHQNAKEHPEDPLGTYYIDTGKCGALNCLDYFSDMADLEHLRSLCEVTNDHDMWIRKMVPLSDRLNNLVYAHGFHNFMAKYMEGMDGYRLHPDDEALMADHDRKVTEYIESCTKKELPYNGCYIECDNYMSDISIRLGEKYDWIVMRNPVESTPGMTKISVRTTRKDLNLGKTISVMGLGGGGHPGAAGQVLPTKDLWPFIEELTKRLFGQ